MDYHAMCLDHHQTRIHNDLIVCIARFFLGDLGTWHGKPYDIKLKPDTEPYHGKHFPVPRINELTFKQELDRIEALKVINVGTPHRKRLT